jgi:hypothetical protein
VDPLLCIVPLFLPVSLLARAASEALEVDAEVSKPTSESMLLVEASSSSFFLEKNKKHTVSRLPPQSLFPGFQLGFLLGKIGLFGRNVLVIGFLLLLL